MSIIQISTERNVDKIYAKRGTDADKITMGSKRYHNTAKFRDSVNANLWDIRQRKLTKTTFKKGKLD